MMPPGFEPTVPGFEKALQTPYEKAYKCNADETLYLLPDSLRGTPTNKITESSPYWDRNWTSLDAFIALEEETVALKSRYMALKRLDPSNTDVRAKAKLYLDNVSKHRKIRQIFGGQSRYHPNQLVSKQHMPPQGLCDMDLMYKLACKISGLAVLNKHGIMAMDCWDFIRWRISIAIRERLGGFGSAKDIVRSLIFKIFEDNSDDLIMREAVLLSAKYQGSLNRYKNYGRKVKTATQPNRNTPTQNRQPAADTARPLEMSARDEARRDRLHRLATQTLRENPLWNRRQAADTTSLLENSAMGEARRERLRRLARALYRQPSADATRPLGTLARDEARGERRRQLAAKTEGYQGVNAFRALKKEVEGEG